MPATILALHISDETKDRESRYNLVLKPEYPHVERPVGIRRK